MIQNLRKLLIIQELLFSLECFTRDGIMTLIKGVPWSNRFKFICIGLSEPEEYDFKITEEL